MKSKTRLRLGDVTLHDCGGHRQCSRSVSWNSTGSWLAWASSDRLAKIWTVEGGSSQGREVTAIAGHGAAVDRVRFHPNEATWLCTSAQDRSIRLWDVRAPSSISSSANQRSMGRIDLLSSTRFGSCPASVEWCSSASNEKGSSYLAVTERDDSVHIYDVRKIGGGGRGASSPKACSPVQSFNLHPYMVETCQFSPSGKYLVAATTLRGEGMGGIRTCPWEQESTTTEEPEFDSYNGHTGPIYSHVFSPDGKRLATGGSDAIVGLWDVASMVCTHTITRQAKFIRSCTFSYDSKLLASSSEEDGIDLADASNGDLVGTVSLSSSSVGSRGRGGADEIAFHPKAYFLACARGDLMGGGNPSFAPVTVAKISVVGS